MENYHGAHGPRQNFPRVCCERRASTCRRQIAISTKLTASATGLALTLAPNRRRRREVRDRQRTWHDNPTLADRGRGECLGLSSTSFRATGKKPCAQDCESCEDDDAFAHGAIHGSMTGTSSSHQTSAKGCRETSTCARVSACICEMSSERPPSSAKSG